MDVRFFAFLLVSAALIVSPGPDMALVARNAFGQGGRAASFTAWGVATGLVCWGLAAVAGVATLLAASAAIFALIKFAGAVYLIVLGVRSLAAIFSERGSASDAARPARPFEHGAYWQGLLNNLLNPKAAVIFVSVFPQFTRPGDPLARLLVMVATFALLTLGWLHVYGAVLAAAGRRFGSRLRRALSAAAGIVMIGLGARLALDRR